MHTDGVRNLAAGVSIQIRGIGDHATKQGHIVCVIIGECLFDQLLVEFSIIIGIGINGQGCECLNLAAAQKYQVLR